jgi:hypothetical protein
MRVWCFLVPNFGMRHRWEEVNIAVLERCVLDRLAVYFSGFAPRVRKDFFGGRPKKTEFWIAKDND